MNRAHPSADRRPVVFALAAATVPRAASPDIVISQVYGGGGNAGATYTNDFIELYNRGSGAGRRHRLDGAVRLVDRDRVADHAARRERSRRASISWCRKRRAAGGTTALPTPDAIGTISMSGDGRARSRWSGRRRR